MELHQNSPSNSPSGIYSSLALLGFTSEHTKELYSECTRDNSNLCVYRDKISEVIYIEDFYIGNSEYSEGEYRGADSCKSFERMEDLERRCRELKTTYVNKRILDFGCGHGDFLRATRDKARSSYGIELQKDLVEALLEDRIPCFYDIDSIEDESVDTVFMFHSFEHLPKPLDILSQLSRKLISGGTLVIEIPHSRDFLLASLALESFRRFTLWSQHLVLHTRASLSSFLRYSGFDQIQITGIQRYGLANHIHWMRNGKPGGHLSQIGGLIPQALDLEYRNFLCSIDQTDTLLAIAKKN